MNQTESANNAIADLILGTLKSKELRQSDLARTLGVNRSAVSTWVRQGVVPSPRQRVRLAQALELDVETVEAAAVRAKGGRRRARRLLSGHAVAVHPALADALDGLSWEAQEALARTIRVLRETKPQ